MTFRAWALAGTASFMALSGIVSASAQVPDPQLSESQPTTGPTSVFVPPSNPVPVLDERAREALRRALQGEQRIDSGRDRWRNPEATLQFFGVQPSDTVVEIWPGQGWYTSILGPYLKQGDGKLIVGHFDASASNSQVVRQIVDAYRARFAADSAVYGNVNVVAFGPRSLSMAPPNSVDKVLTFRNIHNWMAQGWAEKAFSDFYMVLKPGGILGIEEHRGRTDEPQDPLARDGYVREDYVIQMAREAGFEFIGSAEINANAADTKDHPFGVWTLPPVSRTSPIGEADDPGFDRRRYDEIGESDRMTLRFRKPIDATGVGLPSSRPSADQIPVTIIQSPPPPPRRGRRGTPPPPPTPPPVVAATDDASTSAATSQTTPVTKAPPPPASDRRRGAPVSKGQTPASVTKPVADVPASPTQTVAPSEAPVDAKPKLGVEPVAATPRSPSPAAPSASASSAPKGSNATKPAGPSAAKTTAANAPDVGAEPESKPTATSGPRSRTRGEVPATTDPKTKASTPPSKTKDGDGSPANSGRAARRPADQPAEAKPSSRKAKTKAKASEPETSRPASSRNRNRPEPKADPKKKTSSPSKASVKKATTPAATAKKSPPPAKANPNKPDWVLPPKKKNN